MDSSETAVLRLVTIAAGVLWATGSFAAVVHVSPGPGSPVQDAIAAALPGDTILLAAGTYPEAVSIDKRLRLIGAPGMVALIDPACSALAAVNVLADRVMVKNLHVQGGQQIGVDIENHSRVTVQDVTIQNTCASPEYGINVFRSTRVRLAGNSARGFSDAGIYIGGTPADGDVRALHNECSASHRGLLVEDAVEGRRGVTLQSNSSHDNFGGIFLHNSDGVRIIRNLVAGNSQSGIEADPTSDDNLITNNTISGSPSDVVDDGSGNCWKHNAFGTGSVPPCP